jgi:hypothetical protein
VSVPPTRKVRGIGSAVDAANGNSVLHYAVLLQDNPRMCVSLLHANADTAVRNKQAHPRRPLSSLRGLGGACKSSRAVCRGPSRPADRNGSVALNHARRRLSVLEGVLRARAACGRDVSD